MAAEYGKLGTEAFSKYNLTSITRTNLTTNPGTFYLGMPEHISLYKHLQKSAEAKALPEIVTATPKTRLEYPVETADILRWKRQIEGTVPLLSLSLQKGSQVAVAPRKSGEVFGVTILRSRINSDGSTSVIAINDQGEKLSFGMGTKAVTL